MQNYKLYDLPSSLTSCISSSPSINFFEAGGGAPPFPNNSPNSSWINDNNHIRMSPVISIGKKMLVVLVLSWNIFLPDSTLHYLSEVLRNAWDGQVLVHLLMLGSYAHQSTPPFYAMLRICSISQTNQISFTYITFPHKITWSKNNSWIFIKLQNKWY